MTLLRGPNCAHYITESVGYELPEPAEYIAKMGADGLPRAVAGFGNFNGHSIEVFLWSEGGMTRDFLRRIGEYAFRECGVKRVRCTVAADQPEWLETVKRMGFREWGREPGGFDGQIDNVHLSVTREDYIL